MPGSPPLLRRARPDEADAISSLILRSKQVWGYSDDFMARLQPELPVTSADLEVGFAEVLELPAAMLGYYRLLRREPCAWLEDLFIDPGFVGLGYGRQLFERATDVARSWGCTELGFDTDPNAEAFYIHLGARRFETIASNVIPGRTYPRMRYRL